MVAVSKELSPHTRIKQYTEVHGAILTQSLPQVDVGGTNSTWFSHTIIYVHAPHMVMYESIIFTYNQKVFMGLHHANCTL